MGSQAIPGLTAPPAAVDPRELDRSLLHGIAWTGGAKWAGQLLTWASALIVARLLTPDDYGLVGMASIYLGLITLVSEFGLGSAVIALRDLSEEQVAQLNGLAVLVGVVSCAVSCAAAIPLGGFFHAPQLPAVVLTMSTAFLITAFKTVPSSLLQRDMRFRALAVVETGRAVLLAVSMVAFALLGLRYWTLVICGLVTSAVSPAVFSAVQTDHAALRRYLLRITEGRALITFPASLGLALVAPDFVLIALGDKWQGAIAPLQLLALSTGFRAVTPLLPHVLNVVGESRLSMRYGVLCAVVLPAGFYVLGNRWGTVGIALVWVLVFPILVIPAYRRVLEAIDLSSREYVAALWPAASASLLMGAAVLAVKLTAGEHVSRALSFSAQVGAGGIVYTLTCLALHRERLASFSRMLRAMRAPPRPAADVSTS